MAPEDKQDKTVMMSPDELPTTVAEPAADELPTTVAEPATPAADELPTTVAEPAQDGVDALDDPYYAPIVPDDLTMAQQPVSIPSPVESLPERKQRRPRWFIALVAVLLIAVAGAAVALTYSWELWGGKTIPSVVGQTAEDAEKTLTSLGFTVETAYRAADDDLGVVVSCDPVAGIRADLSQPVTITVTAERSIPDVVGMTVDEATAALGEAGAENVLLTYLNANDEPGTVLDVDPPANTPFISTDQVTLTIAQAYTVPNVEGMAEDDARAALDRDDLKSSVTYVESDAERGTVVKTDPEVGSEVSPGDTVKLSVSSPYPSSPTSLIEYFEVDPKNLAAYLDDEGFSLWYGAMFASGGNAHAGYQNEAGDMIQITDSPESGKNAPSSKADVLASGASVGGVRYAFTKDSLPEGGSVEGEKGLKAVMEACGFTNLKDTCTQDSVVLPDDVDADKLLKSAHFICGTGEQDGYTWAVLIGGTGESTRVIALAVPSEHFSGMNLSQFGGKACNYVAYVDLFTE